MRLIVIPTLNEETSIEATLDQVTDYDVVVCDSNSTDRTVELSLDKGVHVIECGKGYGVGILTGLRYGLDQGYDQIIVMDAESHVFSDIQPYLDDEADIVAGFRTSEKKPLIRRIITKTSRKLMPNGVKTDIRDISSGFRAYSRKFVEFILTIEDLWEAPSYTFNAMVACYANGWKVKEFPMQYIGGKSGLTAKELLRAWAWRANYQMKKPPLPEATLEDVVSFLHTHFGEQFDNSVRRRHDG